MTDAQHASKPAPLTTERPFQQSQRADLRFWLAFLALNALLFLPSYLSNWSETAFWPLATERGLNPEQMARELLVWRSNLDLFRLHAELILLTAAWYLLPWRRWPRGRLLFRWSFSAIYLLALAYSIYENLVLLLYQQEANLYAHLSILVDGLGFVLRHMPVQTAAILAGLLATVLAFAAVIILLRALLGSSGPQPVSGLTKTLLGSLAGVTLLSLAVNGATTASPKSVVSSLSFKLQRNTFLSRASYESAHALQELPAGEFYDYGAYDLIEKPDIYLIFVESYGGILYTDPDLQDDYKQLLSTLQAELEQAGWFAASALSQSPSWGGGSWMAYTSALFGMRVDTHPQYLALFERFQHETYPDFGRTLQSKGYQYVRATSLAAEMSDEEWQQYMDFFGVDRWIRYRDLDYHGMHYGWGPAPPDQYVLNSLHETVNAPGEGPFLLFWITQNSHYPWRKVPEVVADWRAMNDGQALVTIFDEEASFAAKKEHYAEAITYELSFLTDFITKEADDNAIFVLIGDHQPGYISRRTDGFATPLHVISRDRRFLERFSPFGLEEGLIVRNGETAVRHEGLYSLFMRAFLEQYGLGNQPLPSYYPEGVYIKPAR